VILNYTALLSRQATDPRTGADLGEIRAAAERGAALTRQLLTFARRDVANPEPVDVNDAVRGVVAMLERTLGEAVELRLDLCPGPIIAIVDRQQLEQIVINLAINSRDAMPRGGQIVIATERSEGHLDITLRVADTGEGMPPEVVKRAFEPFFTTKPHGKGTGLGLATVYGIVQQNGGEVHIDSEVGVGTAVTIGLRAADDPARGEDDTGSDLLDGRERILLVEDERPLRVATARILAGHGYEVIAASDGVEALEFLDDEPDIDVVVTDIAMPRMRGDELARVISERRPGTRVIMMTGYNKEDGPTTGPLLAKPVTEEELLRAIREVVDGGV